MKRNTDIQLLASTEIVALESVIGINDWLKEKAEELAKEAGGKALEWLSSEFFKAIGIGEESEMEQIKKLLDEIIGLEHDILDKLAELLTEVKFQHLITRSFDSIERITSTYQRFSNLSDVPPSERDEEVKQLTQGILDSNNGISVDLKTIHDVLIGINPLSPGDPGVLQIFMERWLAAYRVKQLQPDVPLKVYSDKSYAYLHGLYIIQYLGISMLANARVQNKQFTMLGMEISQFSENLIMQKTLIDKYIPSWVRNYPYPFFDKRSYVIRSVATSKDVMYGSPAAGSYLDYSVQFRDRHNNNGDEEWIFELNGQNDIFNLRERSRLNYIGKAHWDIAMVGKGKNIYPLRIIMSQNNKMAIGIVDVGAIQWHPGGNNCCFIGSWDAGTEVNIEYSGH